MKKQSFYALVILIISALLVTACGGGSSDKSSSGSSSSGSSSSSSANNSGGNDGSDGGEKKYKIGFSNISVVNTWRVQMVRELEAEAKRQGVELYITDAGGDVTKQISDVQDLMTRGIDALLITPGTPTSANQVMKKALDSGIPVIVFNSAADCDDCYTASIATDQTEYGYVISKWLLDKIGGKGNIIVLNGIAGNSISADREAGLHKAMAELPDGGAEINILATYHADWAYDKGKQAMEQALAAYPEIDAVWSQGGAMSQGAIEAMEAAGRPLVPITGEDNNGFMKLWKSKQADGMTSIAASDPTWTSAEALRIALKILNGEEVPKDQFIPVPTIVDATLDEYVRMDLSDAFWNNTELSEEELLEYYAE